MLTVLAVPVTVESLRVMPTRGLISIRPARELSTRLEAAIVTDVPPLIWTPVPALLVTVTPSSDTRAALSTQTACGAAASTVSPRSTTSWTPTSITLTFRRARDRHGAIGLVDDRRPGVPDATGRNCAA